jgi:hypothetical protein
VFNKMIGRQASVQSEGQLSTIRKLSGFGMLPQNLFMRLLSLERKRAEHTGRRFVLMLVEPGNLLKSSETPVVATLHTAIVESARETDLVGWYEEGAMVGVLYTEVGNAKDKAIVQALATKVSDSVRRALGVIDSGEIRLSFHIFPQDWDENDLEGPATSTVQIGVGRETLSLGPKW